jgi:hypothetical protein
MQRGGMLLASPLRMPFKELQEKFELEIYGTCTVVVTPSENLGATLFGDKWSFHIPQRLLSVLIIY